MVPPRRCDRAAHCFHVSAVLLLRSLGTRFRVSSPRPSSLLWRGVRWRCGCVLAYMRSFQRLLSSSHNVKVKVFCSHELLSVSRSWWCAACGGQYDWKAPNRIFGKQRQHEPPRCKSVSSALGTTRSLRQFDQCTQAFGKPAERWRQPSQDDCAGHARKRSASSESASWTDNHAAAKLVDLEKNLESRNVVKPKFTTDFPEAVLREGPDELTLLAEDEGALRTFTDTTNVADKR